MDSDGRLEALRELTLAFLQEVDSIVESEPLASKPGVDFYEEVRRFEAALIHWALTQTGGRQRRAARLLNLKAATLNALIRRHGIRLDAFKTATTTS
jgi:transcriptional regulator with GAF, ATPase, and Fis domain